MNTNEKLSSSIFNVGRLIKEKMRENCKAVFTQTELEALKFIESNKNSSMRQIADYLYIKPSSATSLVNNLFRKGVIKRSGNKKDRRTIYVVATPKGLKILQKKYKTMHKTINKVFEKLSQKDKENLIKIFGKI